MSLTEAQVIDAFHSMLTTSLSQAKAEKLLDEETLSSAEADLMICGPALTMFFAALRSSRSSPAVPLPRTDRSKPPVFLSANSCPPVFSPMLGRWARVVPEIQALSDELQHDLARIICGLEPLSTPTHTELSGIAAELRSVAIEISQRRSFQERYADDLQTALDHGAPTSSSGRTKFTASFRPPPTYDEASSRGSSPNPSPTSSPSSHFGGALPPIPVDLPPQSPNRLSALDLPSSPPSRPPRLPPRSRDPSPSTSMKTLTPFEVIRETLYAALAEVISSTPSIKQLLRADPTRAYFSSVALAILEVAKTNVTPRGTVRVILGAELKIDDCPDDLRPLMAELVSVGEQAQKIVDEDNETAIRFMSEDRDLPEPRLDRVLKMLEQGVDYQYQLQQGLAPQNVRRSVEGRALQFANRLNALALRLSRLRTFQERQDEVFSVLAGSVKT